MAKGFRAAKDGRTVNDGTRHQAFTSESLSPKTYDEDIGFITTNGSGSGHAFIEHTLEYSPGYLIYVNPPRSVINDSYPMPNSWGLIDNVFAFVTSLPGRLRVDIQSGEANASYRYKYFLMVEPSEDARS